MKVYSGEYWGLSLEFKLSDMWVGVFWRNGKYDIDIWVCLIPCFPMHYWSGRKNEGK